MSKISTSTPSYTYMTPQSVQLRRQYSRSQQTSLTSLHRFPVRKWYWELRLSAAKGVWCWPYASVCGKYHAAAQCHLCRLGCIVPPSRNSDQNTGYTTLNNSSVPGRGKRFIGSPMHPDRLLSTTSLVWNGEGGFFHWSKAAEAWT